jgi:hypothetical protein
MRRPPTIRPGRYANELSNAAYQTRETASSCVEYIGQLEHRPAFVMMVVVGPDHEAGKVPPNIEQRGEPDRPIWLVFACPEVALHSLKE